jgi:hypothetical protein
MCGINTDIGIAMEYQSCGSAQLFDNESWHVVCAAGVCGSLANLSEERKKGHMPYAIPSLKDAIGIPEKLEKPDDPGGRGMPSPYFA